MFPIPPRPLAFLNLFLFFLILPLSLSLDASPPPPSRLDPIKKATAMIEIEKMKGGVEGALKGKNVGYLYNLGEGMRRESAGTQG